MHVIRLASLCCMGFVLLFLSAQVVQANPSRAEAIARIAELYRHSNVAPEQIYDEAQIEIAVEAFAQRLNFRDMISLTGELPEDHIDISIKKEEQIRENAVENRRIGSTANSGKAVFHPGSPQQRNFVTTSELDYTQAERILLRQNLIEMFLQLPPNVRFVLAPQHTFYGGHAATVEMRCSFKALEVETPKSRRLTALTPFALTLNLRRDGDRWLISDLKGISEQFADVITGH